MRRLNGMKENEMQAKIKELKEQLEVEKQVKEKIDKFINKKRVLIQQLSDQREKMRE